MADKHENEKNQLCNDARPNSLARFIRRGMNCSKDIQMHSRAIDFFQAWYNFVKPHKSLRIEVNSGNRRWMEMIPAMAESLQIIFGHWVNYCHSGFQFSNLGTRPKKTAYEYLLKIGRCMKYNYPLFCCI